jgi:NAD-dependent SIR2 family protein deacetylase
MVDYSEELATPQCFQHNPELVRKWYLWRLALVELEQFVSQFTLTTQNVDNLLMRQLLPALVKALRA